MGTAWFRFYEELNDFLAPQRRKLTFAHKFDQQASIKDMIESLGVPHTEIDLILVNGESVDFSYIVQPEDRVSVYPMFESLDISPLARLRPAPLRNPRFILDTHLGKLAKYLRLLGFDTCYSNRYHDEQLADDAVRERRILLTRDIGLLKRKQVSHGYFIRETAPRRQLVEVCNRFDLRNLVKLYTRCVHCNVVLLEVRRNDVRGQVPAAVLERFDTFRLCPACDRVFWQGSHYQRMEVFLGELLKGPVEDRLQSLPEHLEPDWDQ